ncbi:uncharacterized protein ATNIH1004_008665 [Aspergillus tanneri]|uniref:Uncharacterized protein n=1 Tax=Aspergillus tanneri TaxID=1220188 RepID=A0A5M9MC54_9EURO|nr:uncharacterized protein ATNIH1004_008665 [Aspergillus tanneri]KAA8644461.1 hypothetical protein ATNIH1004_008665 [Aspergillus tanneri]
MYGRAVPRNKVKLLGVIIDQGLQYRSHVDQAVKARSIGTKEAQKVTPPDTCLYLLSRLSAVTDYAASVWGVQGKISSFHHVCPQLSRVSRKLRPKAQCVTGMFRTVSIVIGEAEAAIESVNVRPRKQYSTTGFYVTPCHGRILSGGAVARRPPKGDSF